MSDTSKQHNQGALCVFSARTIQKRKAIVASFLTAVIVAAQIVAVLTVSRVMLVTFV